ncbi:hypothetical protein OL548_20275 [Lysinibacillus sp. MHQ-1]|nr:hypothetical protein OL548_20275 [Lysinibacillus sp. MHQ-1]
MFFSPGDMDIINGILDSGVGREIAEARSAVANVGKMNPEGAHVYPVQLYPEKLVYFIEYLLYTC